VPNVTNVTESRAFAVTFVLRSSSIPTTSRQALSAHCLDSGVLPLPPLRRIWGVSNLREVGAASGRFAGRLRTSLRRGHAAEPITGNPNRKADDAAERSDAGAQPPEQREETACPGRRASERPKPRVRRDRRHGIYSRDGYARLGSEVITPPSTTKAPEALTSRSQ
jgi:hypothetical protein